MIFALSEPVYERKPVLSQALNHDNRRGSFRELDEVHDVEFELGFLGATSRLDEVDE